MSPDCQDCEVAEPNLKALQPIARQQAFLWIDVFSGGGCAAWLHPTHTRVILHLKAAAGPAQPPAAIVTPATMLLTSDNRSTLFTKPWGR